MKNSKRQKLFLGRTAEAGNMIVMLFGAVAMAGVITYGLNNIMRGPASTAAEAGRRTIAENNLVASAQLAIKAATSAQSNQGDCDGDGFVEPMPYREAGVMPKPTGGGLIPLTMGASITDPWGAQYGYCVWDPGTATVTDNVVACGGNTAKRLVGAKRDDQPAIAVISAGKNGAFETTCSAFVDTTPADGSPDTPLIVKGAGSDDIVLSYTYAEANGIGGGEWKLKDGDDTTAEISKNIEVDGGADFKDGPLELENKGLVLPGDPGDNTVTGVCDEAKDQQIRRNTSTSPPQLEICDFVNGNGWTVISGGGSSSSFNIDTPNCTENEGGPFVEEEVITMGSSGIGAPFSDGNYLYVPRHLQGLDIYRVDEVGVTFLDNQYMNEDAATYTAVGGVWSDGHYIYYGQWSYGDLMVSTYDGTQLQTADFENASISGFTGISGQGEDVFIGSYSNGINHVKMVAGDIVTTHYATGYNNNGVLGYKDDYVFAFGEDSGTNYLIAYEYDGSSLNYVDKVSYTGTYKGFAKDNTDYIYLATTDYLKAYEFDGNTFTLAGTLNDGTVGVYSDGTTIFAGRDIAGHGGAQKLEAYSFDGANFTLLESFALTKPDMGAIAGDGNKLYITGVSANDTTVLSGYECRSHTTAQQTQQEDSTTSKFRADPLDDGLIAHWKMDEGSGNIASDSIGDADAVFQNSPEWTNGPHGTSGLSFTSANSDALIIPSLFNSATKGTVSVMVNVEIPESSSASYQIFGLGPNFNLFVGKDKVRVSYSTGGGSYYDVINADYALSGWHHIVYTFDTTTEHVIYVDGKKVASNLSSYQAYSKASSLIESYIGKKSDSTNYFNGSLDDVRLYDRVLSPGEIASLSKKTLSESNISEINSYSASLDYSRGKIFAGSYYGCMIKADGSPWCWGDDTTNEALGNTATSSEVSPIRVETPTSETYYLTSTNSDQAPASNAFSKKLLILPPVAGTMGNTAVAFTAGQAKDGYGFTEPSVPGIDDGTGAKNYSVVMSHTAQACIDTKVFIARVNSAGTLQTEVQLGAATNMASVTTHTFSGIADLGTFATTDRIRVRYNMQNVCTSAPSMTVNYDTASIMSAPISVPLPWIQITGFLTHTCGLRSDGTAWCWGSDTNAALGNGALTGQRKTPSPVYNAGPAWSKISAGNHFTCGIKTDGTLWCWGSEGSGRLGNGSTSSTQNIPVQVGVETGWRDISAGNQFACGVKNDGTAWCWGSDANAQLGNGATSSDQSAPVQVLNYGRWKRISAGGGYACGVQEDGSGWCWGTDSNGLLGNGPVLTAAQDVPSRLMSPGRWADISTNRGQHACGIKTDGSLWCWGTGTNGRLGINSTSHQSSPRRVFGNDKWIAVSTGYIHSCGMKDDRSVWCWGDDTSGGLGNGASLTGDQLLPTAVTRSVNEASWTWNDAASIIMGPYSTNIALNGSFLTMYSGSQQRAFGFTASGQAVLRMTSDSVQFGVETTATNASSQTTFKTATTSGAALPTPGPVARWLLDEAAGATAASSVGSFPGTVYGSATWLPTTGGKIDGALSFDGTDDAVGIGRSATLEPNAVSVSLWVKLPIVPVAGTFGEPVFAKVDTGNNVVSYGLAFASNSSYIQFVTGHSGATSDILLANTPITPNRWVHVVASYDPGGTAPQKKLYINGVLSSSSTLASAIVYDTSAGGYAAMGIYGAAYFKGEMDDVQVYDRQLTDAEVLALYGAQNSASQIARSIGIDYGTSNFEIARNAAGTDWLNTLSPDIAINASGSVGIGTATPASKLDVSGGIKVGSENYCAAGRDGAIRYTGSAWQYCDGTSWNSFSAGTTYWRTDYNSWSAAGGSYGTGGCAIATTGIAYCWGKNDKNRVGDNTATTAESPVAVHSSSSSTPWSDWKSISTSEGRSCGIRADGTAWCWGSSYLGHNSNWWQARPVQVLNDTGGAGWADWKQITVGDTTTCGIRTNGTAWCWNEAVGDNTTNAYAVPVQVHSDSSSTGWTDWVFIDSGYGTTCGIRANGTAWCWARWNWPNAMTGNNSTADHLRPVQVHSDSSDTGWTDWKQLDVGSHNVCGVRYNGTAWCWGNNGDCVTGNAACGGTAMRPTQVQTDTGPGAWDDWVQVTTMCGVRANGTAWCWGPSTHGRIGYNYDGWWSSGRPAQVHSDTSDTGWTDWVGVKALRYANCGMRANGSLWCWGADWDGQLGNGSALTANQLRPSQVANP